MAHKVRRRQQIKFDLGNSPSIVDTLTISSVLDVLSQVGLTMINNSGGLLKKSGSNTLFVDFSIWDGNNFSGDLLLEGNIDFIKNAAINSVKGYYRPYQVNVREGAGATPKSKMVLVATSFLEWSICGDDLDLYGLALPIGGFVASVYMDTIRTCLENHYNNIEGRSLEPEELGRYLGYVISHEAGHLYGLTHEYGVEPGHMMYQTAEMPLREDIKWSRLSYQRLRKNLGLR